MTTSSKDRSLWSVAAFWYTNSTSSDWKIAGNARKLTRTRVGGLMPGWRQKIQDHANATTSLDGVYVSVDSIPLLSLRNETTGAIIQARGDIAWKDEGIPNAPTISGIRAHEMAVQKFLKKLRATQTKFAGQVFLGELKEAMHMLRHPAEGLMKAIRETYLDKLKRIKKRDPKRWKKAISQTWLEGSFGWRPFISDLTDAAEAYNELLNAKAERYENLRAYGSSEPVLKDSFFGTYAPIPGANTVFWKSRRTTESAFCVIRGQARGLADTTPMSKLKVFGLLPEEFVPTVWELLPWSFLVDYFTNVGDILENSVTHMSDLVWASESTILQSQRLNYLGPDRNLTKNLQGPTYKSMLYSNSSQSNCKYRSVTRRSGADLSIPPLRFELPGRPTQGLNILALFDQTSSGLHPQRMR